MKNILTIDFDIIMEPSISLYNNQVPGTDWNYLSSTNSYGSILIGNYNTYNKLTNYLLYLTKKLSKEQIHIIFDHDDVIQFLNPEESYIVTNIDHHHDCGYKQPEESKTETLNCGNWVKYVPNLVKYFWVKNPNSSLHPTEEIQTADINDMNLNNLTICDELFLCFSIPWVPPCNQALFYIWLDILNTVYDTHFDFAPRRQVDNR